MTEQDTSLEATLKLHLPLPDDPKELAKAMFWENDQKARASRKRNQS